MKIKVPERCSVEKFWVYHTPKKKKDLEVLSKWEKISGEVFLAVNGNAVSCVKNLVN